MFLCDNHWNFEPFQYFHFETNFLKDKKPFQQTIGSFFFYLKILRLKVQHFCTKLLCQKPMLRKIVWGVQSGHITKNRVLPVTTFFENFVSV